MNQINAARKEWERLGTEILSVKQSSQVKLKTLKEVFLKLQSHQLSFDKFTEEIFPAKFAEYKTFAKDSDEILKFEKFKEEFGFRIDLFSEI